MFELPLPLTIALVVGTIAFAASGAVAGVRAGMDWLGVSTLAAVTAIGGGTLRDLLMVTTPFWLIDFWPTVGIIAATVLVVWIIALAAPWQTNPGWVRGHHSWSVSRSRSWFGWERWPSAGGCRHSKVREARSGLRSPRRSADDFGLSPARASSPVTLSTHDPDLAQRLGDLPGGVVVGV